MPNIKKIQNFDRLATNPLRRAGLEIAEAGLQAVGTHHVIETSVRLEGKSLCIEDKICALADTERIFVIGVGKCAPQAVDAMAGILSDRLHAGIILGIEGSELPDLPRVKTFIGSHPLPSDSNIAGAQAVVGLLKNLTERDLVVFIISGGGSTLLCLPQNNSCHDERLVLQALMDKGAKIQEINTVRKHMSLARGGHLAKHAYPAQVISLIFSDVPGNNIEYISSGPTVKDTSTVDDAAKVLAKYDVLRTCNIDDCGLVETPKEDKYFLKVQNILLVTNERALTAMADRARSLGFQPTICNDCMTGEARTVGLLAVKELSDAPNKVARLYGGETTVTLRGHGRGGRNQELALGSLQPIAEHQLIIALASDGRDNSEVAGAVVDTETKQKAEEHHLNPMTYLDDNNSFEFWQKTGDAVITGSTGSNVSDLLIALKS